MAKRPHTTAVGYFTSLHKPRVAARVHNALQVILSRILERLLADYPSKKLKKYAIDDKAHTAATSPHNLRPLPTRAEAHAGNYKMGHITVGGLDITIENPAGSHRRPEWPAMAAHYGYIKRTEGADGDHVDVFVAPGTDSEWDGDVFIIDQAFPGGGFDEHKCLVGYPSRYAAVSAYLSSYQRGWRLGPVSAVTLAQFKSWLRSGDTTTPFGKMAKADEDHDDPTPDAFALATTLLDRAVTKDDFEILTGPLTEEIRRQYLAAGKMELVSLDLGTDIDLTDLINTRAVDFSLNRGAELVGKKIETLPDGTTRLVTNPDAKWAIDDTTRDNLLMTVAEGVENGWSNDHLAKEIKENFSFSDSRAEMIAQTELAHSYVNAHKEVAIATGAIGKRSLLGSEHDEEVPEGDECDDCADAGVVAFDTDFSPGFDFPPYHPRCVCDFVSVYPGDDDAEGLEGDSESGNEVAAGATASADDDG